MEENEKNTSNSPLTRIRGRLILVRAGRRAGHYQIKVRSAQI